MATAASGEAVGLGTVVSVFRSQATSDAAAAKMQMYVFIYLFEMDSKDDKCCVLNEECPTIGSPSRLLHFVTPSDSIFDFFNKLPTAWNRYSG